MATKLTSTLKRELAIEGEPYMLAITPAGLRLTRKGRRKGHEIAWRDLVSGDAALAVALNASLAQSSSSGPQVPAADAGRKKRRR
jgi:hypothetical protein